MLILTYIFSFIGVIALASILTLSAASLVPQADVEPKFTTIYKDPDGAWPGQNSHSPVRPGYVKKQPSVPQHSSTARIWFI